MVATDWSRTAVNVINVALTGIVVAGKKVREVVLGIADGIGVGVERFIAGHR